MELTELKDKIIASFTGTKKDLAEVLSLIEKDNAVYPFNEYEFLICNLIEKKGLTFQNYCEIRREYIRQNPNLSYFELAGRTFGNMIESNLLWKYPDLQRPSKELDANYKGEYDFWLDGIKIEVKAGRALESNSKKPLVEKALASNTPKSFDIILEQIKPDCCDVLVFVVVYRDNIVLWILSSNEVKNLPTYSDKQHRGNTGEGQFHIKQSNIKSLDKYKFTGKNLKQAIQKAANRK